jgi:GT2 family glycosyltransferase
MPVLSYVIVTHNRRESLLRTLAILRDTTPLPPQAWECWVVDNASTDGSVEDVRHLFPRVHIIRRPRNEGVGARSHAFGPARGRYLVLLDDDSYPIGDAVTRSIAYLDTHPTCGAVVGKVLLPDGSCEACAMPAVMLSGAVCLRKSIFEKLEAFRPEFFRKAGEYDLSFRMWEAGWSVERFEDVVYRHDKVLGGRSTPLAHRMDLRNNLILVSRYLPAELRRVYREDWGRRYVALARHAGCRKAAGRALWEARAWELRERFRGRQVLSAATVEHLFDLEKTKATIAAWAAEHGIKRVVLADYGKNLYAPWRACRELNIPMGCVADNHPAFARMHYRGLPIAPDDSIAYQQPDGLILSTVNPAQIDRRLEQLAARFSLPTLRLWQPRNIAEALREPVDSEAAADHSAQAA